MKLIKKVSATPVQENTGAIIDSLNTTDNPHTNAPSINAIKNYVDNEINNVNTDLAQCVVKGDIAVITGNFTAQIEQGSTFMAHNENINYPTGFNVNNTIVLAIGIKRASQVLFSYSYGTLSDSNASAYTTSSFGKAVITNSDNMQLKILYEFGASRSSENISYDYKLVLMKVS